jgi:hypothetical protein
MRRFAVSLLVLVAILVLADRVSLWAAQRDVAKRLQAAAHVHTAPQVEIHGFPFLTQLISGDYHDVDIRMTGLDSDGLRIDRLTVHLSGAHVSIGDVLSQDRSRIHVDQATARLHLTYPDLGHATVTAATVRDGDTLVLTTPQGSVSVTLTGLPFGIRLTSAKATQTGVDVTGRADGLVLRT